MIPTMNQATAIARQTQESMQRKERQKQYIQRTIDIVVVGIGVAMFTAITIRYLQVTGVLQ